MRRRSSQNSEESLETFLAREVFAGNRGIEVSPDQDDAAGFKRFMERYTAGLAIERAAAEILH
jgi:hypothetical protein